jgi:glycosyltransferase involved in cell wall biosynthesis
MKVSIITAVLDGAETIEQTIRSVLEQEGVGFEYLVVDGGSTDGTVDLLGRYPGIRWSSEKDTGISAAFNRGVRQATGEIVGIISADDFLCPDALRRAEAAFRADPGADVVYGNAVLLEAEGRRTLLRPEPDLRRIDVRFPLRHPSVFVRRSTYERYGLFDERYRLAMDYELILRFHRGGATFRYLDAELATIRSGGLSTTRYRDTIRETRAISIRYGLNPVRAHWHSWAMLGKTVLKKGLERQGLYGPIDWYRARTGRFESIR